MNFVIALFVFLWLTVLCISLYKSNIAIWFKSLVIVSSIVISLSFTFVMEQLRGYPMTTIPNGFFELVQFKVNYPDETSSGSIEYWVIDKTNYKWLTIFGLNQFSRLVVTPFDPDTEKELNSEVRDGLRRGDKITFQKGKGTDNKANSGKHDNYDGINFGIQVNGSNLTKN